MGVGLEAERGKTERKKTGEKERESELLSLSVFASCTHKSAGRQSGCSYSGKVPIK